MSSFPASVVVREVGLRDGLQSIATVLATERKKEWIRAAHDAGHRKIEVGSFYTAKQLPHISSNGELSD
jgi:hydroxymethylglutaryl-CoA lyase